MQLERLIVDLHGNRNSALARWFERSASTLTTEMRLACLFVMADELTKPHHYEEVMGTRYVMTRRVQTLVNLDRHFSVEPASEAATMQAVRRSR
jgi:hypothetical protein